MQQRVLSMMVLVMLILAGCSSEPAPGPMAMDAAETERWEIALVEWRIEKNEAFMDPAQSPLPAAVREGFEGLDYYFPEDTFRYRLTLAETTDDATVSLSKAKGEDVTYAVRGTLRFRHGGQDCELTVFGPTDPGQDYLFLPFYDRTNGETTYSGGRYLDLELAADGTVEVDFNKAYNPLCAYGDPRWNCTLPPASNTLPILVEAGEKLLAGTGH
jgi:uncharacterized protein (DUF1684 family)